MVSGHDPGPNARTGRALAQLPPEMSSRSSANGFTLTELLLVVALIGTMAAMALPVMKDMTASIKLNDAARMVVGELQDARLKAVSTNRVFRVRMNCPSAGYIRRVEVLATAVDSSAKPVPPERVSVPGGGQRRDDPAELRRSGADAPERRDRDDHGRSVQPRWHGERGRQPVCRRRLRPRSTLTITRSGKSKTVTINAVGKIQLQ